ncbi:MAG TPA: histidine kinase [Flavitalea sp.]|nr:histidine kinase [Flavitalea sp.]
MKHDERPYIFIAIFCLVVATVRYYILEGWGFWWHVIAYFLQFILVVGIWQLVGLVNSRLEAYFTFEKHPIKRIVSQVFITMLMISPVFILSYTFAKPYIPKDLDNKHLLMLAMILFVTLLLMIFAFYAYDFFRKLRNSMEEKSRLELAAAKLEQEKSLMQYHHLRNQVNPHFLFNTLSSLDGLIQSDPALASDFVRYLSKVYRYVLEHKENEVVRLETETAFIHNYISLLNIRYGTALKINLIISPAVMDKGIVMVTLQMLIDNAIKHNQVDVSNPLTIEILDEGDKLLIRNNKQARRQINDSTKQGLHQLRQIYGYLAKEPVDVNDNGQFFTVKLPLL